MKPLLSTPWLQLNIWWGDWLDENGNPWVCDSLIRKMWHIPKRAKEIRVHAYRKKQSKNDVTISLFHSSLSRRGFRWGWHAFRWGWHAFEYGISYKLLWDTIDDLLYRLLDTTQRHTLYVEIEYK